MVFNIAFGISQAKVCALASIVRLKNMIGEPLIFLASRLYYYSLSYELTGGFAEIRG